MTAAAPRTEAEAIGAVIAFVDGDRARAWVLIVGECVKRYRAYLHTVRADWVRKSGQLHAHPQLPRRMYERKRAEVNRAAAKVALALANLDEAYAVFEDAVREVSRG